MKKPYLYRVIIGSFCIAGSVLLGLFQRETGIDALVLFNAGVCLIVFAVSRHMKYGKSIETDELTKRMAYISLAASFQLTLFGVFGLWWVNYFYPFALSTNETLTLIVLFMAIVSIVTRMYYAKKIDRI